MALKMPDIVELRIRGRSYECLLMDWDGRDKRFLCKAFCLPEWSGWRSEQDLLSVMVQNTVTSRCCNVHGRRLAEDGGAGLDPAALEVAIAKRSEHNRKFLACPQPGCDVGLWSRSSSLPAGQELRTLRSMVFRRLQEDTDGMLAKALELQLVAGSGYLMVGMLNVMECERLLGVERVSVEQPDVDEPVDTVRRRLVVPARSIDLE